MPWLSTPETKIEDEKLWKNYQKEGGQLNIKDWRRENINDFVKQVSIAIKKGKNYVKFGISPTAVWRHNHADKLGSPTKYAMCSYDDLYGDSRKWLEKGWVDYLIPQLYQGTEHPHASFKTMVEWWDAHNFEHHLYIGHAMYKLEEWKNDDEIINQLLFSRKYACVKVP